MTQAPARPSNSHLESELEKFFTHRVRLLGGIVVKVTAASSRGVPDRLVLLGGKMYLVELKVTDGELSQIQRVWHHRIRSTGNRVHVVYGREGVLAWLRQVAGVVDPGKTAPRQRRTG